MARSRGLQTADAEDLAQSVFLKLVERNQRLGTQAWRTSVSGLDFHDHTKRNPQCIAITTAKSSHGEHKRAEVTEQVPDEASSAEFYRESQREVFRWVCGEVRPSLAP